MRPRIGRSIVVLSVTVAMGVAALGTSCAWSRPAVVGTLRGIAGASGDFRENIADSRDGLTGGLIVRARGLVPWTTYRVTAGGKAIGTMRADRDGRARAIFAARRRAQAQLLTSDPRGKVLAVGDPRRPDGDDVLEGEIDDAATPGAVACCLPAGDDERCAALLLEECVAAGGAAAGEDACDPDPCSAYQ